MTNPLPTVPVHAIDPQPDAPQWLVRDLWTTAAVGVVGGSPKVGKSWFGLDLAVSVASGTPALGRFPVDATGPALVYLAEDALPRVRDRVAHLCRHRGLDLSRLDLQVVTADRLRLDTERDQLALDQTVQRIRPALLLLDPLVRLHSLDENSASDISSLLAFLRAINRRYHLALILVHHMAKRSRRNLGQSLRGSSDLHAWTDSACYLVRRPDDRLQLTVEHRSAPAPDPLLLRLSGGGDQPLSLLVDSADAPPPPLAEAVRAALRSAGQPLSRTVLRQRLRVNNARLGVALQTLQQRGLAVRGPNGWHLPVMIRTLGCLPALIRPPFRCSTVPLQARARNGTTTATLRVIYPATNLGPGRATQLCPATEILWNLSVWSSGTTTVSVILSSLATSKYSSSRLDRSDSSSDNARSVTGPASLWSPERVLRRWHR